MALNLFRDFAAWFLLVIFISTFLFAKLNVITKAYNTLRHFKSSIYIAISSLVDSSLPHVSGRENKKALQFVENQLKVNLSGNNKHDNFMYTSTLLH